MSTDPDPLQVKELGAIIYNCSHLAEDLEKTFQTYWVLGTPQAVLPKPWPRNFSTHINRFHPLRGLFDGVPTTAYFSVRWPALRSSGDAAGGRLHTRAGAGPAPAVGERCWKVADPRSQEISRLLRGFRAKRLWLGSEKDRETQSIDILYLEGR